MIDKDKVTIRECINDLKVFREFYLKASEEHKLLYNLGLLLIIARLESLDIGFYDEIKKEWED